MRYLNAAVTAATCVTAILVLTDPLYFAVLLLRYARWLQGGVW